jgi:hypothetical protein
MRDFEPLPNIELVQAQIAPVAFVEALNLSVPVYSNSRI